MRIRSIKPEFWRHFAMSQLKPESRLLAIGLLNLADDEGYFDAHPAIIRGDLMPYEPNTKKIPALLADLERIGYITLEKKEDGSTIGHVCNFLKHQVIQRPKPSPHSRTRQRPIIDESMTDQRPIIDESLQERKGREQGTGKGKLEASNEASQSADLRLKREKSQQVDLPHLPQGDPLEKREKARRWAELKTAMVRACGCDTARMTDSGWGEVQKAVKVILKVEPDLTPAMLQAAADRYREAWPKIDVSPSAIAKHWPKFGPAKKGSAAAEVAPVRSLPEPEGWRELWDDFGVGDVPAAWELVAEDLKPRFVAELKGRAAA